MYRIENKRAAILRVQSMLRALSYDDNAYTHVPRDGIYGSETEAAVVLFQTNQRLSPTGRVDYATFVALRDARDALSHKRARSIVAFPLTRGMQGADVSLLHGLIKKFDRLHPNMLTVPDGSYYSGKSEEAVRALADFFCMPYEGGMTQALYRCLLAYLRAYDDRVETVRSLHE